MKNPKIPTGWREVELGEIVEIISGGTPKTSVKEYWNGNIPWLTPKDLSGYNNIFIGRGERNITDKGLKNSSAKLTPKGSILLTTRAPIGYLAISDQELATNQGFKSFVVNNKIANNKFMYYLLKKNTDYLKSLGTGSTFAEVSKSKLEKIKFYLPPLAEQKAISKILSSLDSKIERNKMTNKILEEIGKGIFKKYCIKHKLKDKKILGDLISLEYGKGLPKMDRKEGEFPVYGSGGFMDFHNEFLVKGPCIILGRAGCPGRVHLIKENCWPVDSTFYVKTNENYFFFIYYLLKKMNLGFLNSGSAVPGLNRNTAYEQVTEFIDEEKIKEFNNICKSLFNKIWFNESQNQTLSKIRDLLLPKLMTGKIRVPVGENDGKRGKKNHKILKN